MNRRRAELPPWALFALPAAITVPIVAGVLVAGPFVGFVVALVIAAIIVFAAIRMEPRERRRRHAAPSAEPPAAAGGRRSAAIRNFLVAAAIAAAGVVLIAATTGTPRAIGWAALAVAATLAISLVFLEIGYSEDRARAREQPARERRDVE